MANPLPFTPAFLNAWEVFTLFVIPIGGGIPAGILLARSRGISWPEMSLLYLLSDVALAFAFDPLMHLTIAGSRRSPFLQKVVTAMRESARRTTSRYGSKLTKKALVMLSFGVDPMTGRAAAKAAGHGFIAGWTLAITGDMGFFWLLMISTLCLSGILGDGTWATLAILVITMVGSHYAQKWTAPRTAADLPDFPHGRGLPGTQPDTNK